MAYRVLYMYHIPQSQREITLSQEPPGFESMWLDSDDPAELRAKLAQADFVVATRMTAEELDLAPRLKLIQHPGVGYEHIDVDAATARGIPVAVTPEGTCVGVAEHTVLMLLALYKHLIEAHNALKVGHWIHGQLRPVCLMLEEKRVGIVGLGRIGRAVATRLRGFDADLVYYDIRRLPPQHEQELGVRFLPLDELLATSDVVTLHVFLGQSSHSLIGEREIALMKPSAILLNTSRGSVVDEDALYRALKDRRIAAAGLDVFVQEPLPPNHPFLTLDNVLLTPHMATGTRDADIKKDRAAYNNFQRVIRGEAPLNVVQSYRTIEAGAGAASRSPARTGEAV